MDMGAETYKIIDDIKLRRIIRERKISTELLENALHLFKMEEKFSIMNRDNLSSKDIEISKKGSYGLSLEAVSLSEREIINVLRFLEGIPFQEIYLKNMKNKGPQFIPSLDVSYLRIGKVDNINFGRKDIEGYLDFSTFIAPTAIYKYDPKTNKLELLFQPKTSFKSEDYETKQVFYASKDGTKIPMFITCKKGIVLDGNNPCFLFGYGGFNSYYSPEFRMDRALFLENGGVYAIPGLRGGGDYGEDWHKAGTKCNKQNVFDDFIAAAEYLIKEKYTSHA